MIILVTIYAICWYPLYLINTYDLFRRILFNDQSLSSPTITLLMVVLSHFNCALNPLIYAYGVPGFKQSLRQFLPQIYLTFLNNGKINDLGQIKKVSYTSFGINTTINGSTKHPYTKMAKTNNNFKKNSQISCKFI